MQRRELLERGLKFGAVTTLMVPAAGCETLLGLCGKYVKLPKLSVRRMELLGATLSTLSVRFITDISNPHPIPFRLAGLDYALALLGSKFASGTTPKGIDIKASGKSTTPIDIDFDLGKTATAILDMIGKKSVAYTLDLVGKVQVPDEVSAQLKQKIVEVPTSFDGKMPMPQVPPVSIAKFDVRNASARGVGFRIDTAVKNTNDFDLPIDGLDFAVKIGGKQVLRNKTLDGFHLKANKTNTVPFDFDVDLVDLGLAVADLARNPKLNWAVDTHLKSGKLKVPFSDSGSVKLA